MSTAPTCLTVGLSETVAESVPEAKYVLRTILRIAGFGTRFVWAGSATAPLDVFYGPEGDARAAVSIRAASDLLLRSTRVPVGVQEEEGLIFLRFPDDPPWAFERRERGVAFGNDIVRSCFWLLNGAAERSIPRDRHDNFDLSDALVWRAGLMQRPLVSVYGACLRGVFADRGKTPLPLPWTEEGARVAFAFSHDVDYPEILRSVEALRLLRTRGLRGIPSTVGVLGGSNHFWQFDHWVDWEKSLGTRPTFYFSAVKGSFLRYAAGTPDCFYDVRSPRFQALFGYLREEGCEIGLHASYHSHESATSLAAERLALQEASGAACEGLRHHYWRLNPAAPSETLEYHERAGFTYDSSLGFEFAPGFRRSVCHPFHAYHPEERRELRTLQLPPAWMDDHFDRRLAWNRIESPDESARTLLDAARATGGIILVDYHARGMNEDFFPRYGPWLKRFVKDSCGADAKFTRATDIASDYLRYEARLDAVSSDECAAPARERLPAAVPRNGARIAVITLQGSRFGTALLQGLATRTVPVALVIVVANTWGRRVRLLRRLATRIGWRDALLEAFREVLHPSGPSPATLPSRPYSSLATAVQRVDSVRSPSVPALLREHRIDLVLLGQSGIVPEAVLTAPGIGTLNAHPGILPDFKGMDSAAWSIHQDNAGQVGSSLHWVDAGVDTGPIIERLRYRWRGDETLSRLGERLYDDCIRLLVNAAEALQSDDLPSEPNSGGTLYHKMPRATRREVERKLTERPRQATEAAPSAAFARRSAVIGGGGAP